MFCKLTTHCQWFFTTQNVRNLQWVTALKIWPSLNIALVTKVTKCVLIARIVSWCVTHTLFDHTRPVCILHWNWFLVSITCPYLPFFCLISHFNCSPSSLSRFYCVPQKLLSEVKTFESGLSCIKNIPLYQQCGLKMLLADIGGWWRKTEIDNWRQAEEGREVV